MPRLKYKKTIFVGALILLVSASGAGSAYGYWSNGGSGTGTVPVAAGPVRIQVNQTSPMSPMSPDMPAQDIYGDFTNDAANAAPLYISTVTVSIGAVTSAVSPSECGPDDFTITNPEMTVNNTVPVGTHVGSWSGATIQMNNTARDQSDCASATVTLNYTATSGTDPGPAA